MDILVSDLAKLFGLTSQTLHYYETKDILCPKRDVINNYRYYESSDLKLLGAIKKYRNAGFSLQDTLSMCHHGNESYIISQYETKIKHLQQEVERKQQILNQLNEDLALYARHTERPKQFFLESLEGFYRFESPDREIIFQDQVLQKEAVPWFTNILFTRASQKYVLNKATGVIDESGHGMIVTKSMAEFLQIKRTDHVHEIEGGIFLTCIVDTNASKELGGVIKNMLSHLKANSYVMRDHLFGRTLLVYNEETGGRKLLIQLLAPIISKN